MMKRDFFVNYLGSLAFISIILLFLFSLLFISRFTLDEGGDLHNYVSSTKTLLDDIDEVEKNVNSINGSVSNRFSLYDVKLVGSDFGVLSESYINSNVGDSFFTLKFNYSILEFENYYIIDIDENFDFKNGQVVLFEELDNDLVYEAIVLSDETNYIEAYNVGESKIENVLKKTILGVVIYEKEN